MALVGEMQYLTIGGNTYSIPISGGSTVQVEQNLTSGTKTATITVDGTPYELFAPSTVTETDPVFNASAAASITSTDISNWNAKVSDTGKWNDVSLTHGSNASGNDFYVPMINTVDGTAAIFNRASSTPMNYAIAKYGSGAYLYSTTPSANDNSTKVATTAYVDAAIPDVSGFSTTDEKLAVNGITNGETYSLIMGQGASMQAATRHWDGVGLTYYGNAGSTTSTGTARINLGNSIAMGTSGNKQGILKIYGINSYAAELKATDIASSNKTIELPNKSGTVALTSDIPTVPTITLNGTSTTTPSFYAPTTAGTNGYFLKSNGSGAPTWAEIETTAAQIVRW